MKIPVLRLASLLSLPAPPMLIDGLVMRQGVTGLSADTHVGKTFLALEMARAVVTGGDFLGRFPTAEGAVCFVGQDASVLEYAQQVRKVIRIEYNEQKRVIAVADDMGILDPVRKLSGTDFDDKMHFIIQPGIDLEDWDKVASLIDTINAIEHSFQSSPIMYPEIQTDGTVIERMIEPSSRGANLVILDTLLSMHGMDENSNTEMQIIFKHLRQVAEQTRAAVLITHHHPHSTDEWRGASSQPGSLDGHLSLTKDKATGIITLEVKKFRGIRCDNFKYMMEATEDDVSFKLIEANTAPDDLPELVMDVLESQHQGLSIGEIASAVARFRPYTARDALRRLVTRHLTALSTRGRVTQIEKKWSVVQ